MLVDENLAVFPHFAAALRAGLALWEHCRWLPSWAAGHRTAHTGLVRHAAQQHRPPAIWRLASSLYVARIATRAQDVGAPGV